MRISDEDKDKYIQAKFEELSEEKPFTDPSDLMDEACEAFEAMEEQMADDKMDSAKEEE